MKQMKLSEIIYENEYTSINLKDDIDIAGISTDTRKKTENCIFVCLRGVNRDSHDLISAAVSMGAAAIVVEEGHKISEEFSVPILIVKDPRKMLAFMWARYCGSPQNKMRFCGVTGTNGKTSTSEMIYRALIKEGIKCAFIGTGKVLFDGKTFSAPSIPEKNTMTTPDPEVLYPTLAALYKCGCERVVMEVSSHALFYDKVAPIEYDLALFTNLSPEHLDFHGDMENYFKCKLKLFKNAKCGIINCDDKYADRIIKESGCKIIRCGIVWDSEICAKSIEANSLDGISYLYSSPKVKFIVKMKIPGIFSVYNSLLALSAAIYWGVSPKNAREALSEIEYIDGRMEKIIKDGITVIIDYAHTEEALKNLLNVAVTSKRPGTRIITVFGCGGNRDTGKRSKMGKVSETLSDFTIITSDNPRNEPPSNIIRDILEGFSDSEKRCVITNRRKAIIKAIETANRGDVVIIAGKGHERYQWDSQGIHDFDEREVIDEAFRLKENGDKNEN